MQVCFSFAVYNVFVNVFPENARSATVVLGCWVFLKYTLFHGGFNGFHWHKSQGMAAPWLFQGKVLKMLQNLFKLPHSPSHY